MTTAFLLIYTMYKNTTSTDRFIIDDLKQSVLAYSSESAASRTRLQLSFPFSVIKKGETGRATKHGSFHVSTVSSGDSLEKRGICSHYILGDNGCQGVMEGGKAKPVCYGSSWLRNSIEAVEKHCSLVEDILPEVYSRTVRPGRTVKTNKKNRHKGELQLQPLQLTTRMNEMKSNVISNKVISLSKVTKTNVLLVLNV